MDEHHQLMAATRGDRQALRAVVEQWWRPMRRWALLECGDAVVAEDAVQDALLRLVRGIGQYDPARPFPPWLRTLVRNASRDQLRRRGRLADRESVITGMEPAGSRDLGREMDVARAASDVRERFAALTVRQREMVELVDIQGRSPSEAAEMLGLSSGAVRNQLHTARRRLREALVDRPEILPLLREA